MGNRSYSQLNLYAECGEKYRLQRLVGFDEEPNVWLSAGSRLGEACDTIDLAALIEDEPHVDHVDAAAEIFALNLERDLGVLSEETGVPVSEFLTTGKTKDRPEGRDLAWWKAEAPDMLRKYAQWRDDKGYRLATIKRGGETAYGVELPIELDLGNGTILRGFADRLFVRPDGKHEVLDLKGLDVDTPLPTPSGWTTMGEVRVGDHLLGQDGKPTKVTMKSGVKHLDCYRVTFDDGSSVVCDEEHLWRVHSGAGYREQVVNVVALADSLAFESPPKRVHRVRNAEAVDLPRLELPIDPYALGVWIGDGKHSSGEFTKHVDDGQIAEELRERGLRVERQNYQKRPSTAAWYIYGFRRLLRESSLYKNKHIPAQYLRASVEQRLDLLRGLMDTDGTYNTARGRVVFSTVRPELARQVEELVLTLGERCHRYSYTTTGFGKEVTAWAVEWRPTRFNPFILERKARQVSLPESEWHASKRRVIVSIEKVPTRATQCVQVDNQDSMYLAGRDFVPTHNSGQRQPGVYQLATYAYAIGIQYGIHVEHGSFFMLAKDGHSKVQYLGGMMHSNAPQQAYRRLDEAINGGHFVPNVGGHCYQCPMQAHCRFV